MCPSRILIYIFINIFTFVHLTISIIIVTSRGLHDFFLSWKRPVDNIKELQLKKLFVRVETQGPRLKKTYFKKTLKKTYMPYRTSPWVLSVNSFLVDARRKFPSRGNKGATFFLLFTYCLQRNFFLAVLRTIYNTFSSIRWVFLLCLQMNFCFIAFGALKSRPLSGRKQRWELLSLIRNKGTEPFFLPSFFLTKLRKYNRLL